MQYRHIVKLIIFRNLLKINYLNPNLMQSPLLEMYYQFEEEITKIEMTDIDINKKAYQAINISIKYLNLLEEQLLINKFQSKQSEIEYFKFFYPNFFKVHYYYNTIYNLENEKYQKCLTKEQEIELYNKFREKLKYINESNLDILKLFKPEPSNIDKKLFLRKNYKWRRKNFTNFISESYIFNTVSNVVGKHKAIKKLIIYTDNKIYELSNSKPPPSHKFKWTASKVLLMELIYSLYLIGFINQGKVELTELVLFFETNFDIELNNHNNIIQDIKMRKINKFKLLDQLKEVLSNKLDT